MVEVCFHYRTLYNQVHRPSLLETAPSGFIFLFSIVVIEVYTFSAPSFPHLLLLSSPMTPQIS